jgi:hypothetical protein
MQALLSSWLLPYGFCQNKADHSVYTLLKNGQLFALTVYVDDCLLIGRNCQFLVEFKQDFSFRFKIEDFGPTSWILGCSITRDRSRSTLSLVQTQYLKDVISDFGMSECNSVSTPMSGTPYKLSNTHFNANEMPYAKLVGKLLYASNCTRPDITASVNYLRKFMSSPHIEYWLQAKRVLRYLKGTLDKGLVINKRITYTPIAWQDSSFADGPCGKSRTGYAFLMCGAVVAWGSRLQPTVALSTMEAEYMLLCAATQEVMFLRQLLTKLSIVLPLLTFMMEDNTCCIAFAKNSMTTRKSKHINVKLHFVRDAISSNVIIMQLCSTHDMLANILTKFVFTWSSTC